MKVLMQKTNKLEGGFIVGIVLLALVVLGVSGFFIYQNILSTKPKAGGPSQPTPVIFTAPPSFSKDGEPKNGEVEDWLIFSKNDVPYTFKYPKNIKLLEQEGYNLSLWGPTQKTETEFYDGISISFSLPTEFSGSSLKDYVEAKVQEIKTQGIMEITIPMEEITVNSLKGYTFTAEGLGTFKHIYLISPDKKWIVEISDATKDPTNQGFAEIVEKILATFEFK